VGVGVGVGTAVGTGVGVGVGIAVGNGVGVRAEVGVEGGAATLTAVQLVLRAQSPHSLEFPQVVLYLIHPEPFARGTAIKTPFVVAL
jgi:L-cystine uptake protein TcyP (sodium:dicarboxylate symporter family)